MKIGDVVVGCSYEYKPYAGSKRGHKATVLEVGVELERHSFVGVRARIDDRYSGKILDRNVPARCLHRLWAEAKKEYDSQDEIEARERDNINALALIRTDLQIAVSGLLPNTAVTLYRHGMGYIAIQISDPADADTILDLLTEAANEM